MDEEAKKPRLVEVETDPASVFDDLAALRKQSRLTVTKRELLTVVPVGRPPSDQYFRVNPDPEMMLESTILKMKDGPNDTVYYVVPAMRDHPLLVDRLRWVLLVVTYSWPRRQIGLWPVAIDTGRGNSWWTSGWAAYEAAKTDWIQMQSGTDRYSVFKAEGELPAPEWPKHTLPDLLKIAFRDTIINHDDVPIMRRLRGLE
jgi:hypothetical protein